MDRRGATTGGIVLFAGGGPNRCGTEACVPKTCTEIGAECGSASDGCSATIDCGECVAPEVCGGGGEANVCATSNNCGGRWPTLTENARTLTLPSDPNQDSDANGYTEMEEWLHEYAGLVDP